MSTTITSPLVEETETPEAAVSDYIALLKPRVMSLAVFTALCGLLVAPGTIHPLIAFTSVLCITVGAGASGALNMWYDRDIDAIMTRTKQRPLPQNKISPENALAFGLILSGASVLVMAVGVNFIAAFWLAFTIAFYALVYTVWLKRSTPQNIVIGGAAGALPPVIGWASVTGSASLEAWLLFLIIFIWTPSHFWALALVKNEDYKAANIPMLPVTHGEASTKRQIFIYSLLLVVSSVLPYVMGMNSKLYLGTALGLGTLYVLLSLRLFSARTNKPALQLFAYSIVYLFCLFLALTLDNVWFVS